MCAISRAENRFDVAGMDLYVMRFLKDGSGAISKPCRFCEAFIKASGLRRVYYLDRDGSWNFLVVSRI